MTESIFQHSQNEPLPKGVLDIAANEIHTVYNGE
jgi:hypothetical protein